MGCNMLIESFVHFKEDDMFYITFYISNIKKDHLYSQKKLINFTKVRYCYWVKKSKNIFKLLNWGPLYTIEGRNYLEFIFCQVEVTRILAA